MTSPRYSLLEVMERGVPDKPDRGCWLWVKATTPWGYGKFGHLGRTRSAHRTAWEIANGPIPSGLCVLHHCDVPACTRTKPDDNFPEGHLFLGTIKDNTQDMIRKGRRKGRAFPLGSANQNAKLTTEQVEWIRSIETPNFAEIGRQLGLHRSSVRSVYLGEVRSRG